jgi:hypothetical protein
MYYIIWSYGCDHKKLMQKEEDLKSRNLKSGFHYSFSPKE